MYEWDVEKGSATHATHRQATGNKTIHKQVGESGEKVADKLTGRLPNSIASTK